MQDLSFVPSKAKFCLIQFHVHSISMHPSSIALKFNCALFFQSHHQSSLCFLVDQAKLDFVSPSWSFGPPCVWSNRSPSDLRRTFWISPVSSTTNQKHIRVFRNFFNRLQPKKQLCPKTVAHISENCLIYVFCSILKSWGTVLDTSFPRALENSSMNCCRVCCRCGELKYPGILQNI